MNKRKFKITINQDQVLSLKEELGYFVKIEDTRVFIYRDYIYRKWYVTDLQTGAYFAYGDTFREAKEHAKMMLPKLKEKSKTKEYNDYKRKREELMKDEV